MTDSDSDLQLTREQGFFDKSRAIRIFLVLVLGSSLFVFLHFREVRVEMLELGARAERYIVAQVDVEFYDDEATSRWRDEAVRDVRSIYALKEDEVRQARLEFDISFSRNEQWRQRLDLLKDKDKSPNEVMRQSSSRLEDLLISTRFTDPRTLSKLQSTGMPTESYHIFAPEKVGTSLLLPSSLWREIRAQALTEEGMALEALDLLIEYLGNRQWTLVEDAPTQRTLRKRIRSEIPDQYTKISAGSRVIDQGERVTSRHLAMLQAIKKTLGEQRNLWHPLTLLGSLVMVLLIIGIVYAYFRVYHRDVLSSNRRIFLVITVVLLTLVYAKVAEYLLLQMTINVIDMVRFPLFVPLAAILICGLLSVPVAFVLSAFLTIILTMALAVEHTEFMLVNFLGSFAAILSMRSLRQRKEIFTVCAKVWLVCLTVVFSVHLYQNTLPSWSTVMDVVSVLIFTIATAIFVLGLLPLFESAFRIITDVTLMEYMDPNQEVLRRLSIEAPGTYQHSMVVGTLAEAAALAIGANGLFCRASTLFHDIGKLATPHYFTENQQGGMNMHQLLTPLESAQVIIAHVSEGVALARKLGLPEQFIDIIKEHHGTTLAYYFYHQQVEKMGGDPSLVDQRDFRYSGPKPRSKESAIIMIADSFEAASRSLDEITGETLTELIDRLVANKAKDGQFDHCLLTFEELGVVKRAMVNTLVAAGHARIKYPSKPEIQEEKVAQQGLQPKEASESAAFDQSG